MNHANKNSQHYGETGEGTINMNTAPRIDSPEPRIDSHQHFWRLDRGDYGWLAGQPATINRDFEPEHLLPLLTAADIQATVVVQAAPSVAETEYLLTLAQQTDFIAGVVGWVDLEAPDCADILLRMVANPFLVGIRPMIQDIADPEWMLRPALDEAFHLLMAGGLCFDALILPVHLPHLLTLLQRYPSLSVVIDHAAKPDIAGNGFEPWASDMAAIARQTDAYCKLSGLLTEAGDKAGFAELQPWMQHLLDHFGPERLLWGSDWPVLNLASSYTDWLAIAEEFIKPEDQALIMGLNANRFYDLCW